MIIDNDKYVDFSLSQEDTLMLQSVTATPRSELRVSPLRTPKKTRLERLPLSETTSALIRVIKGVRAERLHECFEQTCDRRLYEIAVVCGSSQLTYQELDLRANRLAHFLISHGVGEGTPVGVLLERSLDTYVALLGVLKAGAVFVPLDPSFSSDRVAFIAKDAGLRGLVTASAFHEKTRVLPCPVLELDLAREILSVQPESRPLVRVDPASLCYIIYTLDTNGWPRGVAVSHTNIVSFLHVATPIYGVTRHDRVYQGMSTAFDCSFQEIWPAWIAGATLVAGPTDAQRFGAGLTKFLIDHKITVLYCVPTQLAAIESDVPSLRCLFIGGEACPPELISRWSRPGRRMLNMYGPAETTVIATWCELFPGRPVTLGFPLPTYYVYILDKQLRPVEDGETGEICIGGPGVALGYLNRPDITRERFVPNPVSRDRELVPRLYRTGDFGRITLAGNIEYWGPIYDRARVRGYRTELSEIEQLIFPRVQTLPLTEKHVVAPQQARPSKAGILSRLDVKKLYTQVMTDPLYRNSLFTIASTLMLGGLGFIFWIIIARLYKTENVGIATTLISIMSLLSGLSIMGLNSSLNRYLPKSVNKNELINSSFTIVTLVTILISVIFFLGLQIFSPQLIFLRSNPVYVLSFTIFLLFFSWNFLVDSIFMAFRSAVNTFFKNGVISILKLIFPFAFFVFGAYGIFASTSLAFALGVLMGIMILILKFKVKPSISVNISLVRETLIYSLANHIVGFMFGMPSLVLPVLILNILSAKYTAYYYVASMIQNILQVIPVATTQALLTEGSYNETDLKKHIRKAIATISVLLLPAITVVVVAGNNLLQFFGKSYATESFRFLQLYSISTIFIALVLISNAIMNVKHQIKLLVIFNIIASILVLGLSYAFISDKLIGIGWGWVIGQAMAGGGALFFIIRNVYITKRVR